MTGQPELSSIHAAPIRRSFERLTQRITNLEGTDDATALILAGIQQNRASLATGNAPLALTAGVNRRLVNFTVDGEQTMLQNLGGGLRFTAPVDGVYLVFYHYQLTGIASRPLQHFMLDTDTAGLDPIIFKVNEVSTTFSYSPRDNGLRARVATAGTARDYWANTDVNTTLSMWQLGVIRLADT